LGCLAGGLRSVWFADPGLAWWSRPWKGVFGVPGVTSTPYPASPPSAPGILVVLRVVVCVGGQ
jgi:hypothetical protein